MVFLVTGCFGFIGKRMCDFLIADNHKVFGMDIKNVTPIKNKNFEFVDFNLTSARKQLKQQRIDVVFHFAWCGVSSSDKNDPTKQLKNISLTYEILELAKDIGAKKIVIPGSVSEFSKCHKAVTGFEKDSPSDLYAATKVSIRKITSQFCNANGLDYNWALITSVYGGERSDNNLLTYTINNLLNNKEVLTTKLEQLWDYLYIDDLILGLYLIGTKGKRNTIYPIGSGRAEQLNYYVNYIADYLGKKALLRIGALEYKNKYIDNSIVDITRMAKLGFKCQKSFETNIVDVISYYERINKYE